jgi:hypothetical protein
MIRKLSKTRAGRWLPSHFGEPGNSSFGSVTFPKLKTFSTAPSISKTRLPLTLTSVLPTSPPSNPAIA